MHYTTVKGILSASNGMNLFRGCTHNCIYCDSRSRCYQMHHDFEDIEVKENALILLENALAKKRRKCMIGTGAMSDPYIPLEKQLLFTRRALELIEKYGFGLSIQTKSDLILRDLPLLKRINERAKCVVSITITTFDDALCKKIEPGVCPTSERIEILKALQKEGVPCVVWLTPILPFINDTPENLLGILRSCAEFGVYGVMNLGMGVTLREGNREYFYRQLDKSFPGLSQKYQRRFKNAYECLSPENEALSVLFHNTCRSYGMEDRPEELFRFMSAFPPPPPQISMWD